MAWASALLGRSVVTNDLGIASDHDRALEEALDQALASGVDAEPQSFVEPPKSAQRPPKTINFFSK